MAGMEGVLVRKKNNFRVVIALDVILQSVAVEVDAEDLEPAANHAGRVVLAPDSQVNPISTPSSAGHSRHAFPR